MKIDVLHAKNYNTPKLNYTIYRHRCPQCSSILQINASEKIPNKIRCPICGYLVDKDFFVRSKFMDAGFWDITSYEV